MYAIRLIRTLDHADMLLLAQSTDEEHFFHLTSVTKVTLPTAERFHPDLCIHFP